MLEKYQLFNFRKMKNSHRYRLKTLSSSLTETFYIIFFKSISYFNIFFIMFVKYLKKTMSKKHGNKQTPGFKMYIENCKGRNVLSPDFHVQI